MLKGFKEFIMRGNLVELAVAFIIGGAFATVVTSFTAVILSLISKITGEGVNFDDWKPGQVPVGAFVTALIAFLIIAFVVYFFVVTPYNKLQARRARGEEPTPPSEEVTLLTEIRDLLARDTTRDTTGTGGPSL
ncbi:MAG TPA: large conductance mechanosensitive channel protein MscL [Nocardioidaceae bacterium]|jgi:large conductance mechanosensitive channel|nr:large conductance mechanosensitive channel protein MscL [Nocardioidaceae bacterium]